MTKNKDICCSVWIPVKGAITPINHKIPRENNGQPLEEVGFADQVIAGLFLYHTDHTKPTIEQCKKAVENWKMLTPLQRKYIAMQWKYQLKMWDLPLTKRIGKHDIFDTHHDPIANIYVQTEIMEEKAIS